MSAVDKYEYKLKTEQMLELMNDGAYNRAAEIADSIDWKRVRNTTMLNTVSEIYEKNRDFQKSYDVLSIAYHRVEGSRKIVSRLCTLALKTRNVDEAIDYYDDFLELAPKDPNQYILKYQILRAQRAPIEQQIRALEQFKKSEYIEEWAYELARLYQEAGMIPECLEECDDLILWFSEGQYVYKAMELKMRYKPLSPSQKAKYDSRFEKVSSETEELPNITEYRKKEEPTTEEVEEELEEKLNESEEQIEEQVQEKKKIGNTMKLDEALRSLLNIKLKGDEDEEEELVEEVSQETEDLSELESEIAQIESVADLGLAEKVAEDKQRGIYLKDIKVDPDLEELVPLPDDEFIEEVTYEEPYEEFIPELYEEEPYEEPMDVAIANELVPDEPIVEADTYEETVPEVQLDEEADQIEGQMNLSDFLEDAVSEKEGTMEDNRQGSTPILSPDIQRLIDEIEGNVPEEQTAPATEMHEEVDDEPHENMGAIAEELRIDEDDTYEAFDEEYDEDDYEGFIDDEDVAEDFYEEAEAYEEEPYEEDFYGEAEAYEEEPYEDDFYGDAEEYDASEYEEEYYDDEEDDAFVWGAEDAVDAAEAELFTSGVYEEPYEETYEEAACEDYEADNFEEVYEPDVEDEGFEEVYEDANGFVEDYEEEPYDDEDFFADDLQSVTEGFEEEFRPQEYTDGVDDREIPDEDDEIDLLSATTPLSRKETAKLIATGKTAPLPLDEISDAMSMSNTGFIVHGRYDLKAQSGIGTRAGLTDEQKKLFSYFVPVRGMSEQLVDVLEQDKNCTNRQGTSRTGNLLIIGNKGNGKTVLAVDVVKAIQKQRKIRQGKVAIVTGEALNKKKISDIFDKLYGGALIIEKAGKMNEKTVARLNKAMEHDTGELYLVLEDQRKPLDRLLSSNREFRRKFTSRLEVPVFINDELVTFGQTYAQENGYKIDEMSILALYSRIDSLQREDHAVTVAEVKEIMDEAMAHSQKVSAKKLVKRVFGRNTDSDDRIILTEKDFNL